MRVATDRTPSENGTKHTEEQMDEMIRELKKAFREITGGGDIWGGRSAEINGRVARLMNREVAKESPKEEYARILKEAKVEARVR
jgi:hypothetical protein